MSRSRGTKIERDNLRRFISRRVSTLMDARLFGLGTCPFNVAQVYQAMFTPEQHHAISLLPKSMFETSRILYIRSKSPEDRRVFQTFTVTMPTPTKWPEDGMTADHMDRTFYQTFIEWAERRVKLQQESHAVKSGVDDVLNAATTYGQIRALWPTMESFMPTEMREQLTKWKKSKASQVVKDAWENRTNGITYELAEHWLTEGMLFEGATDDSNDNFSIY